MPILKIEKLKKIYSPTNLSSMALNNISFNIKRGEFVAIMGPSGSGKTTLLNCISTFDTVSSGKIYINNIDITDFKKSQVYSFRRNELGFIHQEYNLLNNMTVYDNIAIALTIKDCKSTDIDDKILRITKLLNIDKILDKYPFELSGGERQRCATARALVKDPPILLADEPTGALDYDNSKKFLKLLQNLNQTTQSTILMVTHDSFSASFSKRVLFLKDGKIFNELYKGDLSQKQYYMEILNIISIMGDDIDD